MSAKSAPPAAYYAHKPISCNACRKRKLKCDRVKPCSSCVLRGIEGSCYQDDEASQAPPPPTRRADTASSSRQAPAQDISFTEQSAYEDGRGAKRPRSSGQQTQGQVGGQSSHRRQGEVSQLTMAAPGMSGPDAANLIRDVLENLQREQQRLEGALIAVQQAPQNTASADPSKGDPLSGASKTLEDLSSLPPAEVCEDLLSYYVNELSVYTDFVAPAGLFAIWQRLCDGLPVSTSQASHIVIAIVTAANMLSHTHPAQEYTDHGGKVELWERLGERLAHESYRQSQVLRTHQFQPSHVHDDLLDSVQGAAMFMMYYALSGQADHLWVSTGYTVRRGVCCGLFDIRHRAWKTLTAEEHTYRIKLARHVLFLDRWQAMARASPFAIHPIQVHLDSSTNANDPHFSPVSLVLKMLEEASDLHDNYDALDGDRFRKALDLDARLEHKMRQGLAYFSNNEDKAISSTQGSLLPYFEALARSDAPIDLREFKWMAEVSFLRCLSMRRFLLDTDAPIALRYRSLEHAQCLVAMATVLSRLLIETGFPVSVTSHGHQLLCAMTAFDVVISGADDLYSLFIGFDVGAPFNTKAKVSSSPKPPPAPVVPRPSNGAEMTSSRARDWQLERRLPPLMPAGMLRPSTSFHNDFMSPSSASSGHPSTSFAESQSRHTQQQPGRRRSLEQIQWLEMQLPAVVDFLHVLEQRGVLNGERGRELLRLLFDVAARLKKSISPNSTERMPHSPAASPSLWSSERPALVSPAPRSGPAGAQAPRMSGHEAQSMRNVPPPPPPSYFAARVGHPTTSLRSPVSPRDDEHTSYDAGHRASSVSSNEESAPRRRASPPPEPKSAYGRPHLQPFQPLAHQGQHRGARHDEMAGQAANMQHGMLPQPDARHSYTSHVPYSYPQPPHQRPLHAPSSQPRPLSHQHPSPPHDRH